MGNEGDFWMTDEPDDLLANSGKIRRKTKNKKMEFLGWGSRPLIDFLESISKDTSKQISHFEVTSIVNDYVKSNNLTHPDKKKRIMCDERLLSLFGKKSFPRVKIHEFLGKHFVENQSDSDTDFFYSSDENEERSRKRQKATSVKAISSKKRIQGTPKSCFAAIIPANIKLLYLKKRLVQDLYKDEDFERKLVGSFVRVKSDPNDYLQKNSHLLVRVTCVKRPFGVDTPCSDILLEVSNMMEDIRICQLSDDNFSEEECEDLRDRVKSGSLQRPTTVEFQAKAESLHENITKHWLERELYLLQNLIDRANEKGWRKELFEHLERKQLLQTPAEQKRLLLAIPEVVADDLEIEAPKEDCNDSPASILRDSSIVSTDSSEATPNLETQDIDINKAPEVHEWVEVVDKKVVRITETVEVVKKEEAQAFSVDTRQQKSADAKRSQTTQVIDLSDDSDDDKKLETKEEKIEDLTVTWWHYVDPKGKVQGPFSLETLKGWYDAKYFPPAFKVFQKRDQANPVLLSQLLSKHL